MLQPAVVERKDYTVVENRDVLPLEVISAHYRSVLTTWISLDMPMRGPFSTMTDRPHREKELQVSNKITFHNTNHCYL